MKRVLLIGIAVVAFFAFVIVGGINKVIGMDENVKASWAEVENQLKRRNDLIPNLVNTVKGYAAHEKEVFTDIAEARSKLAGSMSNPGATIPQKVEAANAMNSALSRLLMIAERYPDLKAQDNFARLQDELAGTENRISVARMRYNEGVKLLNKYIRKIPGRFYAAFAGVEKGVYFKVEEKEKAVPVVKF